MTRERAIIRSPALIKNTVIFILIRLDTQIVIFYLFNSQWLALKNKHYFNISISWKFNFEDIIVLF